MNRINKSSPKLSLCMIVKNEERFLPKCLRSVNGLVDEIIIVDTGSDDNTVEIAKKFRVKLYTFTWCDDFAKARNESIKHASGDWIIFLDADEMIPAEHFSTIHYLIKRPDIMAISVKQCIPQAPGRITTHVYLEYCRIFRNLSDLKFNGRVHEQILPSIKKAGGKVYSSDIVIDHWGFAATPEKKKHRAKRNLALLLKELQDDPNYAFGAYNLGLTYRELQNPTKARQWLKKAIVNGDGNLKDEIISSACINLAQLCLQKNEYKSAQKYANMAVQYNNRNPLPKYILASIAVCKNDFNTAVTLLEELVNDHTKHSNVKMNKVQLLLELGSCYVAMGNRISAQNAFMRAITIDPNSSQAKTFLHICQITPSEAAEIF